MSFFGFLGFLQRQETNRVLRRQNRLIEFGECDRYPVIRTVETPTATMRINTPNRSFSVNDALDRPITVKVPHTFEKVTEDGEIVTETITTIVEIEVHLD